MKLRTMKNPATSITIMIAPMTSGFCWSFKRLLRPLSPLPSFIFDDSLLPKAPIRPVITAQSCYQQMSRMASHSRRSPCDRTASPAFSSISPPRPAGRKTAPARAGAAEHPFAMTRLFLAPPHQCAKPAHSSQQRDHAAGFRNAVGSDIRGVDVDRIGNGECEGLGQRLLLD